MPASLPVVLDPSLPDVGRALAAAEESWAAADRLDDPAAAESLLGARGDDLDRLLALAGSVRDAGLEAAGRPGVLTYSRKVFLPLTHLCRDRCHYCVFVQSPARLRAQGLAPYMSAEDVLEVARGGAALGCKEALLTLGDRPEDRWPEARAWLDEHGYASTLDYVGDMARLVRRETGLLPHLNPGVMTWGELQMLKDAAPSMGMMLETTSTRLWAEPGQPHHLSPDKEPAVRLRVLEDAGLARVPFTTGVLLGLGETPAERVEAMLALRDVHDRHGHLQEVIVQNFRAKTSTAMRHRDDLDAQEHAAAVAVTRLVLGPGMRVQAPPNLADPDELALLVRAGIDDWGGISPLTPDHVNPERPWPEVESLAARCADLGFALRERLTTHPSYLRAAREAADGSGRAGADWVDDRLLPHVLALADADGLALDDAVAGRSPAGPSGPPRTAAPAVLTSEVAGLLRAAEAEPSGLDDAAYARLLAADGADLERLAALADEVRRDRLGDVATYVVNRNLDPGLDPERLRALAREAADLGATEVCVQGPAPAGSGAEGYLAIVRAVTSVTGPHGGPLHLHAFRPAEVIDGAARAGLTVPAWLRELRAAGLGTVPGTAARILDDEVRAALTAGTDVAVAAWLDSIETAHAAGLRSTATIVYGHLETPAQQVAHLRTLAGVQDRTGGFTELIAMPFVPAEHPFPVDTSRPGARPGPSLRETRAVHAVARLLLDGRIDHVQAAWPKLGVRGAERVLAGGADDLGGALLDGVLDPGVGAEAGRQLLPRDLRRIAERLGRTPVQRTTLYDPVPG
ncbi:7,8-didemethyl-8-hydroxy-5-deazariboflavin synthase CofG [Nocardioides sp. GY 10127]|uniref:7,8-didemethyl-8-hydroxy-5-deazariboflavin synthase CofG n=1 Tax=Nocardioides sp. GY 10127 TaxID=2569762 RepID=UPI0010A82EFC|nr:7,8-didemethyl-8-hydroxy-5-deazariboflavin synthase CofG [Nocardioides sp. GY 10127]TIC79346.1 7,8-didemethyl-8-hydroxy-5-deazariboflavin synthase subunit CofG [Nocardioides sp. GY 10127]